ncbi:MAG: M48 family metalloprotease [Desulforhopalus sp.]
MLEIIKIAILATWLIFAGCTTLSLPGSKLSTDKVLLDQVNGIAKNDPAWFSNRAKQGNDLLQKYKGQETPGIAIYLENDIFIYQDSELSAYILEIVNRLLESWEGEKPEIVVIVETGKYFSAYVDELHQLHVSTGLLREVKNEDQLASIIAHEISHILLRHNSKKSMVERAGAALDMGGLWAASAGNFIDSHSDLREYRKEGRDALLGFQSMGFVWVDMLAPRWSRDNEKEADLMGLDLLIRAGYNYEEHFVVIEHIADAEARRSERLENFSKLAYTFIEKNREEHKTPFEGQTNKYLDEMRVTLENTLVEHTAMKIESINKSHDDRDERIDALKTYLQTVYGGGDLPPESSTANFSKIVGSKTSKTRLNIDLAAIKAIDALKDKDISLASSNFAGVQLNSHFAPLSCSIAKSSIDASKRKLDAAVKVLEKLVRNNKCPVEAYLRLAELYSSKRKYDKAEASIMLGIDKIGRDYKFLPSLIKINKQSGNISAAEDFTLRCKVYDDEGILSFIQSELAGNKRQNTYYHKCADILGYDVVVKRQKESGTAKPTGFSQILQKVLPVSQ